MTTASDQVGRADQSKATSRRIVIPEITRFVIGGLLAALLVGAGTFVVISHDAEDQAIRHAIDITSLEARGIAQPFLPANLLTVQPADWNPDSTAQQDLQLRVFDRIVRTRILNPDVTQGAEVVRVKIWNTDGTIVYSDVHQLIGGRFPLGDDELTAVRTGVPHADVSDLTKPENQFERDQGKLLEVYLPIDFNGQKLLFETYQKYEAITQYQQSIWASFLPVLLAGLLGLFLFQIPLAVRLARRVHASLLDREALLKSAIHASERERQRIAQDLHDSVVQDLTAVKIALGNIVHRRRSGNLDQPPVDTQKLEYFSDSIGKAISGLRTLIVEIAPPTLTEDGLGDAIEDLLEPLRLRGVASEFDSDEVRLSEENAVLLYRVAQEAIRNVTKHSQATAVTIRVRGGDGRARLEVHDNGIGFTRADIVQRRAEGHLGLALLKDLVADAGGMLDVEAETGRGTTITAELPVR